MFKKYFQIDNFYNTFAFLNRNKLKNIKSYMNANIMNTELFHENIMEGHRESNSFK